MVGNKYGPSAGSDEEGYDYAGIFGMLDEFCQENPRATLGKAAEILITDMDTR